MTSVYRRRNTKAREQALKAALSQSVLLTAITIPPSTVTAAQVRARAAPRRKAKHGRHLRRGVLAVAMLVCVYLLIR